MKNNYSIDQRNQIVEEHLWCISTVMRSNSALIRAAHMDWDDVYQQLAIRLIISFFRCYMDKTEEFEALVHIYWDREEERFGVFVPKQVVGKARISADLRGSALSEARYLHYADVHSHNSMAAKFSFMDDEDEKATRLYFVIGRLDQFFPEITARFSCGGTYQDIDPALVFENMGEEFPCEWLDSVEKLPQRPYRRQPFEPRFPEDLD